MEFDIQTKIFLPNEVDLKTIGAILQHFTSKYLYVSNGKLYGVNKVKDLDFSCKLVGFSEGCFELKHKGFPFYCFHRELSDYLCKERSPSTNESIGEKFSHNRPARKSKQAEKKEFDVQKLVQEGLVLPTIDKGKQKEKLEELKNKREQEREQKRELKRKLLREKRAINKKKKEERQKERNRKQKSRVQPVGCFQLPSLPVMRLDPEDDSPMFNDEKRVSNETKFANFLATLNSDNDDSDFDNESSDNKPCSLHTILRDSITEKKEQKVTLNSLLKLGSPRNVADVSSFPHSEPIPVDDNADSEEETFSGESPKQTETKQEMESEEEEDPMVQSRKNATQSIAEAIRQKKNRKVTPPPETPPEEVSPEEIVFSEERASDEDSKETVPLPVIPRKFVDEVPLSSLPKELQNVIANLFFDESYLEESIIFHYEGGMFVMETKNGIASVFDTENVLNLPRLNPKNYSGRNDGTPESLPIAQFKSQTYFYRIAIDDSDLDFHYYKELIEKELTDYFRNKGVFVQSVLVKNIEKVIVTILNSSDEEFTNILSKFMRLSYSYIKHK